MKKLFSYLFNNNLGYVIDGHMYYYEGVPYIGYMLLSKYRFFGIVGYNRIGYFPDMEELLKTTERLNISINKK